MNTTEQYNVVSRVNAVIDMVTNWRQSDEAIDEVDATMDNIERALRALRDGVLADAPTEPTTPAEPAEPATESLVRWGVLRGTEIH